MDQSPKFHTDYLQPYGWLPDEGMEAIMGTKEYLDSVAEYNKVADKVLYTNVICHWGSCDCGDGYGCSHGSWVYEITFSNHGKAKIEEEDGGWYFTGDSGETLMISHEDFTMQDFERFCELCNIVLIKKVDSIGVPVPPTCDATGAQ